jgi:ADP-ribose pyrophosphatase
MITDKQTVFQGRKIAVQQCQVTFPSGHQGQRELVEHPGAVVVVAVDAAGRLVLLRQYRFAVGQWLWEVPAGTLEPDEPPIETARRELIEETGYRAGRLEPLLKFFTTPGFTNERIEVFLATGLTAGDAAPEPGEEIEVHLVALPEAMAMIERGEIQDAKTIASILRYAMGRK